MLFLYYYYKTSVNPMILLILCISDSNMIYNRVARFENCMKFRSFYNKRGLWYKLGDAVRARDD